MNKVLEEVGEGVLSFVIGTKKKEPKFKLSSKQKLESWARIGFAEEAFVFWVFRDNFVRGDELVCKIKGISRGGLQNFTMLVASNMELPSYERPGSQQAWLDQSGWIHLPQDPGIEAASALAKSVEHILGCPCQAVEGVM